MTESESVEFLESSKRGANGPLNATAILIELEIKGPGAGADGLDVNQNCSGVGNAMLFADRHETPSSMHLDILFEIRFWRRSYYPCLVFTMAPWPARCAGWLISM